MPEITHNITITDDELEFAFSRSSGPGGQNVNKVNTRVTLYFDVYNSPVLTEHQREKISARLKTRMSKKGVLRVVCQKFRTQNANRNEAIERFVKLLQNALKSRPPRKKTAVPKAVKERRLEDKKRRSRLKEKRSKKVFPEE